MATVQDDISAAFRVKLTKSGTVDQETIVALQKAFASGKRLKADDIVALVSKSQPGTKK